MQVQTVNTTAIARNLEITVKTRKLYVGGEGLCLSFGTENLPFQWLAGFFRLNFSLSSSIVIGHHLFLSLFSLVAPSMLLPTVASELWGQGGTLPPSSGLVRSPVPPSQRYGLCQNFKQTTLTTRLYKFRTDLNPPPTYENVPTRLAAECSYQNYLPSRTHRRSIARSSSYDA